MNFEQKPIIVKNSSNKPSLTFIMSLIMREGSKGEIDFCYGYSVTNKSYNDVATEERIFTVFDAENILSKIRPTTFKKTLKKLSLIILSLFGYQQF